MTAEGTAQPRKPRLALFLATACGLGYLPKAPGTWGSLLGVAVAFVPVLTFLGITMVYPTAPHGDASGFIWRIRVDDSDALLLASVTLALLVGVAGVWSASRAARFWRAKDPQRVVIDEVSGQHLTLLLGLGAPVWWKGSVAASTFPIGLNSDATGLNWKYLLLGFILFRAFDIWKPFPGRQAESLPGGWGIMADDWVAGIYAALGLWVARMLGL